MLARTKMKSRRNARAADWSKPLPTLLTIPDVITLTTLADVRMFVERNLPKPYRESAALARRGTGR
jgi:hypothetical protein